METVPIINGAKLNNKGNLDIIFLGVGSAFAQNHFQTSFLIVKGKSHILVDFGMDGPRALKALGLSMSDIKIVLPTHSHSDHVGGLESLAAYNRYVAQPHFGSSKLKCIITEEYQRVLWDCTLRGGLEYSATGCGVDLRKLDFCDFFDVVTPVREINNYDKQRSCYNTKFGGIQLSLIRTNHIDSEIGTSFISYGLVIDNSVIYTGDMRFDREFLACCCANAGNIKHIFHDVQFYDSPLHTPLKQLKRLPRSYKEHMTLVHYDDNYLDHDISDFAGFAQQNMIYRF